MSIYQNSKVQYPNFLMQTRNSQEFTQYGTSHPFSSSFYCQLNSSLLWQSKIYIQLLLVVITMNSIRQQKFDHRYLFINYKILIMILNSIRKTFNLSKPGKYHFGAVVSCSYPYKFGGIQPKSNNFGQVNLLKQIFGQDVLEGFKSAFVAILGALQDKDKEFLKQTMQMTLVNNIQFPDVELVNENSAIEVNISKSRFILGGQFVRTNSSRDIIEVMADPNTGFDMLLNKNAMKPGSMKIPILFSSDIYFVGKTKLVKKNESKNADKVQNHMLQFQVQNYLNLMEAMKLSSDMFKKNNNDQKAKMKIFKDLLIGKDYQWKVGDMDKVLQGNFNINKGTGLQGLF